MTERENIAKVFLRLEQIRNNAFVFSLMYSYNSDWELNAMKGLNSLL